MNKEQGERLVSDFDFYNKTQFYCVECAVCGKQSNHKSEEHKAIDTARKQGFVTKYETVSSPAKWHCKEHK